MLELRAVALSIRFDAPIFTYENILSKAGFTEGAQSDGTGQNDENGLKILSRNKIQRKSHE